MKRQEKDVVRELFILTYRDMVTYKDIKALVKFNNVNESAKYMDNTSIKLSSGMRKEPIHSILKIAYPKLKK